MTAYADIAIALLAAGQGVRFGSDKLLAEYGGEALGLRAARTLIDVPCASHIAVCRPDSELTGHYENLGFNVVVNDQPERGQAHSLHLAVQAAMTTDATALLVALADMPFVSTPHIMAMLAAYDGTITASTNGETAMPPAIFPRDNWPDLLATSGDAGARTLLKQAKLVNAPEGELRDIDTPADLLASK
jgi:molybdenum cofactor cytidylyltransferase